MLYKFYIKNLQVVHCSVHGLSSLPSSELHPLSVHTPRHSSNDDLFDDPGEGIAYMNLGASSLSSPLSSSSGSEFLSYVNDFIEPITVFTALVIGPTCLGNPYDSRLI